VVHIASHGVFGGSAASSYLLAYDDLLTLDTLQTLLRSDASRRQPIELLTLSACQTAEGNERAPLGLSGAALKARARAVLGTLWPVDDAATVRLMQAFYREWLAQPEAGKAAALRSAQLALLRNRDTRHPYYWAPFALIGNWR
jgi:CHAT domain-containing protein